MLVNVVDCAKSAFSAMSRLVWCRWWDELCYSGLKV